MTKFKKHLSLFAVSTAALILAQSNALQAADLGGDCCADLEERVAELEYTTARKGNRRVSVQLYGHVSKAIMFWDDGTEDNVYVVDNDHNSTRFGLKGKAWINKEWSAGYRIEVEADAGVSSAELDQTKDDSGNADLSVRHSAMWIKSQRLGKLSWGLTSGATDDITHKGYVAKNTNATRPDFHWNRDFIGKVDGNNVLNNWTLGNLCGDTFDTDACFDSTGRQDLIRYDTPKIAGFQLKAAWGEDNFHDVGLYWSGKAGDFKLAATVGYRYGDESGFEEEKVAGSAGLMHAPTGLFVQGAWFVTEIDGLKEARFDEGRGVEESHGWHIEAGIQERFNSLGKTTIWGEYAEVHDGFIGVCAVDGTECFKDSELTRFGFGVTQAIDAAAMEVYVLYQRTEGDFDPGIDRNIELDAFDSVIAGGTIKF